MRVRWILATALLAVSLLAGCGSAPTPAAPAPAPTPAAQVAPAPAPAAAPATAPAPAAPVPTPVAAPAPVAAVKEISVKLADYSFEPKNIEVALGTKLKITVVNNGEKRHDFNISGAYGVEGKTLEPGQNQVIELTADKAGTFEIMCNLRGHKDRGMVGSFIVK